MNYWQGKNIRLRAVEPADAKHFIRWNRDSERGRHLDFLWPPQSDATVIEWAEKVSKQRLEDDRYHWIIEDSTGAPIGSISTHDCNATNGAFSYGVDIEPEAQGKGFAGEAILLVLRYYFEELRYQKVTVPVHADNPASIRLHEKLGFTLEGTLRRMLFTHGNYVDVHWYGMTVEEFREKQG
jgi:RimJ/RimL family protein N-acetyltransferase